MQSHFRERIINELRGVAERQGWKQLIAKYDTPLLVLDPGAVVAAYRELSSHLPNVRLHYAVKALSHPAVLAAVASCGGRFDLATRSEIERVRSLDTPLDECIHTHPVKKAAEIDYAYNAGVRTFVVDNLSEIQKFCGRPNDIRLLVRLAFPNPTATADLSSKFGVELTNYEDAQIMVKHVVASGVQFAGFSFHVGSQGSSAEPFRKALTATIDLCRRIYKYLGVEARVLDIGGGFPVFYRNPVPTAAEIGGVIQEVLGSCGDEFTVLAEPGRYLAAPSMTLLTSVVGTATRNSHQWHYLDDGLYGSYSNIMWDVHPPIIAWSELATGSKALTPVTLAGPTCDSIDVVARDYPMPPLDVGDILVSPMMGAYTAVTTTQFNGVEPTPIVVTKSDLMHVSSV